MIKIIIGIGLITIVGILIAYYGSEYMCAIHKPLCDRCAAKTADTTESNYTTSKQITKSNEIRKTSLGQYALTKVDDTLLVSYNDLNLSPISTRDIFPLEHRAVETNAPPDAMVTDIPDTFSAMTIMRKAALVDYKIAEFHPDIRIMYLWLEKVGEPIPFADDSYVFIDR